MSRKSRLAHASRPLSPTTGGTPTKIVVELAVAAGTFLLARWLFGMSTPKRDVAYVQRFQRSMPESEPFITHWLHRIWLFGYEMSGTVQMRLRRLRSDVEAGRYADDTGDGGGEATNLGDTQHL